LSRPEVTRHRKRILERYSPPEAADTLILLPYLKRRFHLEKRPYRRLIEKVRKLGKELAKIHICIYSAPFGITPIELENVYPLSQNEVAYPPDVETLDYIIDQIKGYIKRTAYQKVVILSDPDSWEDEVAEKLNQICVKEGFSCEAIGPESGLRNKDLIRKIVKKTF